MKKSLIVFGLLGLSACAPNNKVENVYPPEIVVQGNGQLDGNLKDLNSLDAFSKSIQIISKDRESGRIEEKSYSVNAISNCQESEYRTTFKTNEAKMLIDFVPPRAWLIENQRVHCELKLEVSVENHSPQIKYLSFEIDNNKIQLAQDFEAKNKIEFKHWHSVLGAKQLYTYIMEDLKTTEKTKFYRVGCGDLSADFHVNATTSNQGLRHDIWYYIAEQMQEKKMTICRFLAIGEEVEISPVVRVLPEPDLRFQLVKANADIKSDEVHFIISNHSDHALRFVFDASFLAHYKIYAKEGGSFSQTENIEMLGFDRLETWKQKPIFNIKPGEQITITKKMIPTLNYSLQSDKGFLAYRVAKYESSIQMKGSILVSYDFDTSFDKVSKLNVKLPEEAIGSDVTTKMDLTLNISIYN